MPKPKTKAKRKITYRDLEKQVIDEIGVLLAIQQKIVDQYGRGRKPGDPVSGPMIAQLQKKYSASGPEMVMAAQPESTRRARVSC